MPYSEGQQSGDNESDTDTAPEAKSSLKNKVTTFVHDKLQIIKRNKLLSLLGSFVVLIGTAWIFENVNKPIMILVVTAAIMAIVGVVGFEMYREAVKNSSPSRVPNEPTSITPAPTISPIASPPPALHVAATPQGPSGRHLSELQRAILKEKLSPFPLQEFKLARAGFEENEETKAFAMELFRALEDCGWNGNYQRENMQINLGESRLYSGVMPRLPSKESEAAFIELLDALKATNIQITRGPNRSPILLDDRQIGIIVGPNPTAEIRNA